MKHRRRMFLLRAARLLTAGAVLTGCIRIEAPETVRTRRGDKTAIPTGPARPSQELEVSGTTWIAGVAFPEGYDWRRDTLHGEVGCRLLLFRNEKKLADLPVGKRERISADADRHQILDGQLYSDYAGEGKTSLKRNGELLYEWTGEEQVCGLLSREDGLWSLGTGTDGKGVWLRKNGKSVFSDPDGLPLGWQAGWARDALYEDAGELCFAYRRAMLTTGGVQYLPYLVADAQPQEIHALQEGTEVVDVRRSGGKTFLAIKRNGDFQWTSGDVPHTLSSGQRMSIRRVRFRCGGSRIWLLGNGLFASRLPQDAAWDETGEMLSFPRGWSVRECYPSDECLTAIGESAQNETMVWSGGDVQKVGHNLYLMSQACAHTIGRHLYAVFTPRDSLAKAVVWRDGQKDELDFNGYLTAIRFEPD